MPNRLINLEDEKDLAVALMRERLSRRDRRPDMRPCLVG